MVCKHTHTHTIKKNISQLPTLPCLPLLLRNDSKFKTALSLFKVPSICSWRLPSPAPIQPHLTSFLVFFFKISLPCFHLVVPWSVPEHASKKNPASLEPSYLLSGSQHTAFCLIWNDFLYLHGDLCARGHFLIRM